MDWIGTKIESLQQNLENFRKKDHQPTTSINMGTIESIDAKIAAVNDRLQSYEDMHDRFTSPIMQYLDTLAKQMIDVQRDIGKLNDQHCSTDQFVLQEGGSTSIGRLPRASIDGDRQTTNPFYTANEIDQITSELYATMRTMEDRLDKRCDEIYFRFDSQISGLDSQGTWIKKEVKAIQRQLAAQQSLSASIDKRQSTSLGTRVPASTVRHLIASVNVTPTQDDEQLIPENMEEMNVELKEQVRANPRTAPVDIENVQERLQYISNAVIKLDEIWSRNDEATRSFIEAWARMCRDDVDTCFPTSSCLAFN